MRRGWVCGESFVPEEAWRGCCWANNVVLWRSPRAGWRAMAVPWRRPRAPRPGRLDSPALHASVVVRLCAKKFALRARNTPNLTFLRLLGEFCRGLSGEGSCRANLVAPGGPPPSPEQSLARHYPGPAGACRPRHHTLRCLGTPTSASAGVLHYTKPSCGVSPACRTPVSCNSPRLVARARDLRGYGRQSADPLGENR